MSLVEEQSCVNILLESSCKELKMGFLVCFPASRYREEILKAVGGNSELEAWMKMKQKETKAEPVKDDGEAFLELVKKIKDKNGTELTDQMENVRVRKKNVVKL